MSGTDDNTGSANPAVEPVVGATEAPATPEGESALPSGGLSDDNKIFAAAKAAGWAKPGEMPEWAQRRIDGLTARLRTEEQKHAATTEALRKAQADWAGVSAELARLQGASPAGGAQHPPGVAPPVKIDELVAARAAEMLRQQQDEQAQAASAARGREAYGEEFDRAIANVRMAGDIPPHLLDIAMQTGAPEHILFRMGSDMNLASKILGLPPGAMAVEMAKLVAPPPRAKNPPVSKTPSPITPIGGATGTDSGDLRDELSMDEWLKRRNAQLVASGKRRVA